MSNKLNLELKQGEDFFRLLTIKDETGSVIDLTGFQFKGSIKETPLTGEFLNFSFNILNQVTNKGKVEMTLSSSLSAKKKADRALSLVYDVEMNTGSQVKRILQGTLLFDPEVTK